MRKRLPEERSGVTLHFTVLNREESDVGVVSVREVKGYLTTNTRLDGSLGAVFVKIGKPGTSEALIDEWAKVASIALQHGASVNGLFGTHVGTRFDPSGAVLGVKNIKTCTSLLDLISRFLIERYGNKETT